MEPVIVIGGGIAGAAVALALRDRDLGVVVVERSPAGERSPSGPGGRATPASGGMLAPQYETEGDTALFELALESRRMQAAFVERVEGLSGREVDFGRPGMLVANTTPSEDETARGTAERHRARGLRAEVMDLERARELQPGLAPGAISWLWLPDEARVNSQRLATALPAALRAAGAEVVEGVAAVELLSAGGRASGVALADGRRLEGARVVLAAGAWSADLHGLPRRLPVRPVRGQMLRWRPPPAPVRRLVADHEGRYLVPRSDGSLLAGSTMEEAGFDASVTAGGEEWIRSGAARLHPGLADAPPADRWAGLRPITTDGTPIVGEDPDLAGLHYATGYGRNGILVAPAAAERIVRRITGDGRAPPEEGPFAPDRFDREEAQRAGTRSGSPSGP